MKRLCDLLVTVAVLLLTACRNENPAFREIVIDDNAPQDLWMKTAGDVNADGLADIVAGGWQKGGLVAYLAPRWEKIIINDSLKVSTNAEVFDVDHDHAADIVVVADQALIWLSGPEWNIHLIDSITLHDIEVHDFNQDGLPDIVARNQGAFGGAGGHTLYFYEQKPPGTWSRNQMEIADGEGLKMADINGDGKADIVVNGTWLENRANRSQWKAHKFTDTWQWPNTYIDVADMNNDGRPDILHSPAELAKNVYRISWFEAPEDPASLWKEHVIADSVETVVHSIGAADFNSDNRMDVAIAEMQQGADPDEVAIYYQRRNGVWEKQVISTGGCHSMQLLDADADGDVDIVGANFAEHVLRMWINEKK